MTIGTDEIEGVQRFTFGNVQMFTRSKLACSNDRLFAVPHILEVFNSRICDEDQKNYDIDVVKTKLPSFALLKKYFNLMLRCRIRYTL